MSRVQSRENAFKLIFEYCLNKEKNELTLNELSVEDKAEEEYIVSVYNGVIEHYDELVAEVEKYIKNFSLDRIFKVDLAILLLAIYEIKYMDNIPPAVSINEAVNLAKTYSTEKSFSYINGVLSNFVK